MNSKIFFCWVAVVLSLTLAAAPVPWLELRDAVTAFQSWLCEEYGEKGGRA